MQEKSAEEDEIVQIIKADEGISVVKESGTAVAYYLFDNFEIHKNLIPEGCLQDWHRHRRIEETLVVETGSLKVEWLEGQEIREQVVAAGEILRVKKSIHRLSNPGKEQATCVIFRFVRPEEPQADIIKHDKETYSDEDIQTFLTRGEQEHQ